MILPPAHSRALLSTRRAYTLVAVCSLLACAGCQSYEPRPLDSAALAAEWLNRSPDDEPVRRFAERLASLDPSAPAFDLSDGLSLAEAEPVALVYNRELRIARLEGEVARLSAETAGLWEDPVLGLDLEHIVSSVPDPWVIAGTIGLTIPISGRLDAAKSLAGAEHAAAIHRIAEREWDVLTALRESWVRWSAESLQLDLASDLVREIAGLGEIAERQERAGTLSRIDSRLFRVELVGRQTDLIAARARVFELELRLRDLLGLAPEAPVRMVPSLVAPSGDATPAPTRETLDASNPRLATLRAEYQVAEESLRLEIRKQYPDLEIGPGYGVDEGDERILFGIRLPLPLWNRNRQGIAEATGRRDTAHARYQDASEHLAARLAIALARARAGREVRESLESRVIPLTDEQDADLRRAIDLGHVDPLLLLQALRSRNDARTRLIEARLDESLSGIAVSALVGPPAPSPPTTSTPTDPRIRP